MNLEEYNICNISTTATVKLNQEPLYTVGYADDIDILVNTKFPSTVAEFLQ